MFATKTVLSTGFFALLGLMLTKKEGGKFD
jgi:hypothetical protein